VFLEKINIRTTGNEVSCGITVPEKGEVTGLWRKIHREASGLVGLFLAPEGGESTFLRNVGDLLQSYTALYAEDSALHGHRSERLKSYNLE
jgi:hypothetical protein